MKKAQAVLVCLLFLLTLLYPMGLFIANRFDYRFELISISGFAIVIEIISVCAVVLAIRYKTEMDSKTARILSAIITPFSLINAMIYIVKGFDFLTVQGVFVSLGCCFYLAYKYGRPIFLRIISWTLAVIMIFPLYYVCFFAFIFHDFGSITVVQSVESPDGKYQAEIIDSDQGALGGNTEVVVRERIVINAIVFRIEKQPKTVYFGRWGEFKNMEMHWKDSDTLIINSKEYHINKQTSKIP